MLLAAGGLCAQEIDIRDDGAGYLYVDFVAAPWYLHELESSVDLQTWSPTGVSVYGQGQTASAFVYDLDAALNNSPPTQPPAPPAARRFFLRPFTGGEALVSWTGAGGETFQILDGGDYSAGMAQTFVLDITDSGPPYTVIAGISPVNDPPQDYSGATAAKLPPGEAGTWNEFLGARDELLAAIANPSPGAAESAGNGASSTGGLTFFRVRASANDFDGDGAFDHDEAAAGTDPLDEDSDGDGYNDHDEATAGSNPLDAEDRPFDPYAPPAADWYVDADSYLLPGRMALAAFADGSRELPFTTIGAAVASAGAEDVIEIAPGTYTENVTLTGTDLRLLGKRGQADATLINGTVTFAAGVTAETYLFGVTVSAAAGDGISVAAGASPRIVACKIEGCSGIGVSVNGASPTFLGCHIMANGSTGLPANSGSGIDVSGPSVAVFGGCSVLDNSLIGNGVDQVRVSGASASAEFTNCVIWSAQGSRPVGITAAGGAVAIANHSNVQQNAGVYPGANNINADPQLEAAPSDFRIARTSPCVDAGDPAAFTGYRFLARYDFDGEAREQAYGTAPGTSKVDIGADEFVSRLTLPTVPSGGSFISQVDEASGVAFIGVDANGDSRLLVIDDEESTNAFIYTVSAQDGDIVGNPLLVNLAGAGLEVRDLEAAASNFDPTNPAQPATRIYLTTSHTRRDQFREADKDDDPFVDPAKSDYQAERNQILRLDIGANLNPTAIAPYTSDQVTWGNFLNGVTTISPTDAAAPGTIATGFANNLASSLAIIPALGAQNLNTGVLVAWHWSPKFGEPADGQSYAAGTALPYAGGGNSGTAGISLGDQPAATTNAGIVFNADGGLVPGDPNGNGLNPGTVYYFKAWPYAGNGAARVYSHPITAEVNLDGVPRILINEFYADFGNPARPFPLEQDWIELFNPAGVAVNIGGLWLDDDTNPGLPPAGDSWPIPANTQLGPRATTVFTAAQFNPGGNGFGLGRDDEINLWDPQGNPVDDFHYDNGGNDPTPLFSEGRAWDGGPRGERDLTNPNQPREGAKYRTVAGGSHPVTRGAPNSDPLQKYFQATPVRNGGTDTVYLHWANVGRVPATIEYSPKQHDFHPANVEGFGWNSATGEMILGLRSPKTNRLTGDAYYYRIANDAGFLPAAGWAPGQPAASVAGPFTLDLDGDGIRSIDWVPGICGGAGGYVVIAGPSNGGPLAQETGRETFSLWVWDGGPTSSPSRVIADLRPYAQRPEGVTVIVVGGAQRILFTEDRFRATGYDTRNIVHWPISIID